MTIFVDTQTPNGTTEVIERALSDLQWTGHDGALVGGSGPELTKPMAVYRLGIDDLLDDDIAIRAQKVSWRYISEMDGNAAYLDLRDKDGNAKFVSLSQNSNASKLMQAAHIAEEIGDNTEEYIEARILEIPALYIGALWLNSLNPTFITYVDAKHIISSHIPAVEVDFFAKIHNAAVKLKGEDTSPDSSNSTGP